MSSMQPERTKPPEMADVLRPHLSANMKAGMDTASMRIADTPDAKKDAVEDDNPACEKRIGAYYEGQYNTARTESYL